MGHRPRQSPTPTNPRSASNGATKGPIGSYSAQSGHAPSPETAHQWLAPPSTFLFQHLSFSAFQLLPYDPRPPPRRMALACRILRPFSLHASAPARIPAGPQPPRRHPPRGLARELRRMARTRPPATSRPHRVDPPRSAKPPRMACLFHHLFPRRAGAQRSRERRAPARRAANPITDTAPLNNQPAIKVGVWNFLWQFLYRGIRSAGSKTNRRSSSSSTTRSFAVRWRQLKMSKLQTSAMMTRHLPIRMMLIRSRWRDILSAKPNQILAPSLQATHLIVIS